MTHEPYPTIRLLPKISPQKLRFGFPWVYANELVLDRRTKKIPSGSFVNLTDSLGQFLGVCTFNANSKIAARIMDRKEKRAIDRTWLRQKLLAAHALRTRLFDAPYYRLAHAEADGLPGVIIDRFGDTAVIQPNAAWAENMLDDFTAILTVDLGLQNVIKNASGRTRKLEGLDDESLTLVGKIDAPIPVSMNGATFMADVTGGQKTGLFYDQRPNHAFAARLAKDQRVLDVFSHVGGFSLTCLAHGATTATAIDGSKPALDLAECGAAAMGVASQFETIQGDAFDKMKNLIEAGEKYDFVICDPPAFAPNKSALTAGLRAYERVARLGSQLVAKGGYLGLCSCSHAADLQSFRASCLAGIGKSGRVAQILHTGFTGADHPTHAQLGENAYLKALFFRLD
ncbi:MAG: class I SAM-dependent rRNA methyltransferase [Rhodobacterales bacterium]